MYNLDRDSNKKEILVKGASKIYQSKKEFDTSGIEFKSAAGIRITLNEMSEMDPLTIVTTVVKVIRCDEPITLGTRRKQDVHVCDSRGTATLQLWEHNIGLVRDGRSYEWINFRV